MTTPKKSTTITTTKYDIGIFIYRKDLRIEDNRGLNKLNKVCEQIIPIFIFDPEQVDLDSKTKNYLSFPALRFLCESIEDLANIIKSKSSKLYIFYGKPQNVIPYVIKHIKKNYDNICVGFNQDFTLYSLTRDQMIIDTCKNLGVSVLPNDDDFTMCSMELLKKNENEPYKQYGAFRKHMLEQQNSFHKVEKNKINFLKKNLIISKLLDPNKLDDFWSDYLPDSYNPLEIGKRSIALKILSNLKNFEDYNDKRNTLSWNTTHLSAYLNFGLVSEREFYYKTLDKLGASNQLINQIIWRDYYLTLLRFLPGANSYSLHVDPRYNKLDWVNKIPTKSSREWKEWNLMMKSQTGFLLVDAAVQEILLTGFMHNRCRMIVGVFSVKYLLINPLCRYVGLQDWFSRHLLDCSTSQNKLNSQWVTELDFPGKKFAPSKAPIAGRPMNASNLMIKKWDPDCIYIKKWLPHLKNIDNKIIYNWDTKFDSKIHPGPMFDHKKRYDEWIKLCS